ncbi:hypothetical protein HPB50_024408 [Hyalomma asiaticum]|uniref:Uncharacterized protein n=1 Tax=Hyalomma asiaticum TaxID=266040 RepID=A0ACB7SA00_HYAAI|nr:hypothetical protein HPB50_024408 [Hyalomma asiaticum]
MQPLLPRNYNSLIREAHGRDAGRAADGGDGGAGPEGRVVEAEEGVVDEDEVERLASWLSLFRMLVIFLPLFALCMPSLLGDWERARRNESSIASRRFIGLATPPGPLYRRQSARTTCRSRACVVAASNVSLDPTANPCDDLFGHVCNNWIRDHRAGRKAETWEVNRNRRTMDHLHQAALTEDLHKILASRSDEHWLPVALLRLYRKCLNPGPKDAAELRSKLLDSVGLSSWPYGAGDKDRPMDISKVVGNAYYFTNEPALLSMGVGADGRAFLAEPRLLLDALTVGPREVAQAAAAVFLSAGRQLPVPKYVNKVEELLDEARTGGDPAPWNTTLRIPEVKNDTSRPVAAGDSRSAWSSWNLHTVIEEAFEGRETPDEVVVRAASYIDALPGVLKQVTETELLNYLGLRTALLASRMLPAGPEKQLLCRLIDVDDTAPARTATEHCIRLIAKYEPELALYALTALSPLVTGLNADSLLGFLRRQLSSEVRSGALDLDDVALETHFADRIYSMPWIGPAPSWLRNVTLREAYFMRFYEGKAAPVGSAQTSQAMFAWMQEKAVSEHLAMNGQHQTIGGQRWLPGFLSTRSRLVLREEEAPAADNDGLIRPEATLQVPPAAMDLLWGTHPSTAMLQVARIGVRAFKTVLEHLFRWQQRQHTDATGPHVHDNCTPWDAAPHQLDLALESSALSLALRAYLAWPGVPELVLPTLQHLEPEQLFYVFYALNQCEVNGPHVEETLSSRKKARDDGARPGRAEWVNRVMARNEDFARAFRCPTPVKPPNPFRDCGRVPPPASGARTARA